MRHQQGEKATLDLLQNFFEVQGSTWEYIGVHGCTWVYMGVQGSTEE
jgi:hypothetical protein